MTITNPPQDANVVEGGNATFQCAGEEDGMALPIAWQFTPSGSSMSVILITGSNLTGIEMVTVSDGLRTMLTFSGVRREAGGGTVVCVAVGSSQLQPHPATLTVQCESWEDVKTLYSALSFGLVGSSILINTVTM